MIGGYNILDMGEYTISNSGAYEITDEKIIEKFKSFVPKIKFTGAFSDKPTIVTNLCLFLSGALMTVSNYGYWTVSPTGTVYTLNIPLYVYDDTTMSKSYVIIQYRPGDGKLIVKYAPNIN